VPFDGAVRYLLDHLVSKRELLTRCLGLLLERPLHVGELALIRHDVDPGDQWSLTLNAISDLTAPSKNATMLCSPLMPASSAFYGGHLKVE